MYNVIGNIDPVAFRLGPLEVAWYGIIIVIGMFLAIWLSMREANKQGIGEDFIIDLAFWLIPMGLIGARIYYVLFELPTYLADPLSVFYIWEGGIAIYGGLILGFITMYWYSRKNDVPVWLLVDILAPHVMIAQAIGRWGNFVNQEAHGEAVSRQFLEGLQLPDFIIEQMNIKGTYYHPTFLYESVWNIVGFILLMLLRAKDRLLLRGEVFLGYLAWYGLGRFFIEGMRTDSLYIGAFRVSQLLSLLLLVSSIGLIIYRRFYVYPRPPYYSEGIEPEKVFEENQKKYHQKKR
ncbi:phosphatidylglycerol:prolipoprotein diacylglycerol transferase [Alkalibacterium putridalgicola]|uniref:Phosphatidylglycerol--prolipoprotein diacylglyceryl transferase n=1 Tax=Alkalibacterium putridalgicola TaxID=426703 RepID=A0A1H7U9H3_9LACT|nr:prolipoprotein diacylglyceryl transferase [Alkalibacterium putridalgicola]GEK89945.1 prolipoprotein diacylglyceryl transferase [Alkalibacterium putridalgicola]SEL93672.1 phosphatidylglycerol:prolipoprotein diacylglycerol transferase [Alkalibacterium putridalgicola]